MPVSAQAFTIITVIDRVTCGAGPPESAWVE